MYKKLERIEGAGVLNGGDCQSLDVHRPFVQIDEGQVEIAVRIADMYSGRRHLLELEQSVVWVIGRDKFAKNRYEIKQD